MVKVGIIGTGSMGGMFIRKFIEAGAVGPGDILASNRSADKLRALADKTGITMCITNRELVDRSDVVFLCVKPLDVKGVLHEVREQLTPGKLLACIAVGVTLGDIRAWCDARVARVIPSVTSECSKGISLVSFGNGATADDRRLVLSLLGSISRPVEVEEIHLESLPDLTSCGPAFIASLMQEFARAAALRDGIPVKLAEQIIKETLIGTSALLEGNGFGELIDRVATQGGITEEGVKVIRSEMPAVYDHLMDATVAKRELVREKIRDQDNR